MSYEAPTVLAARAHLSGAHAEREHRVIGARRGWPTRVPVVPRLEEQSTSSSNNDELVVGDRVGDAAY
jgi:hypothetical protein